MTREGAFLISLGQALATMGLYGEGHPARERAIDASFDNLLQLMVDMPAVHFSFLGSETIVGRRPMTELVSWEWAARMAKAGVERIEVDAEVSRDPYVRFLEEVWGRMNGEEVSTLESRQLVRGPIRYGALRLNRPGTTPSTPASEQRADEAGPISLVEEIEAISWMHEQVAQGDNIPLGEVEAVVGSLSTSMHAGRQLLLPLLTIKEFDQYTLTHSCNVAMLAIALAEALGLHGATARAFGAAGLLHDIGKVKIPREILIKPGRFTDAERLLVRSHPAEGARIILTRPGGSELAAVVAYEHHIFLDGRGYPELATPRNCHYASRIVHVCDIYDALCTVRPYREAWEPQEALAYIEQQGGTELDPALTATFAAMIREAAVSRTPVADRQELPASPAPGGMGVESPK